MNTWLEALKKYNAGKGAWCLPKKGSDEYNKVKNIQNSISKPLKPKKFEKPQSRLTSKPSKTSKPVKQSGKKTAEESEDFIELWVDSVAKKLMAPDRFSLPGIKKTKKIKKDLKFLLNLRNNIVEISHKTLRTGDIDHIKTLLESIAQDRLIGPNKVYDKITKALFTPSERKIIEENL